MDGMDDLSFSLEGVLVTADEEEEEVPVAVGSCILLLLFVKVLDEKVRVALPSLLLLTLVNAVSVEPAVLNSEGAVTDETEDVLALLSFAIRPALVSLFEV